MHFEGERTFEKFGLPLENALNTWMHGQKLGMKVQKWFDFAVPSPTVKNDFIQNCIEKYEAQNESRTNKFFNANLQGGNGGGKNAGSFDALKKDFIENVFWLGSRPVVCANSIFWNYLQEEECLDAAEVRSIFGGKDGGKKNEEKGRGAGIALSDLCELLWKLRPGESVSEREGAVEKMCKLLGDFSAVNKLMKKLHYRGIVHI